MAQRYQLATIEGLSSREIASTMGAAGATPAPALH